MEVFGFVPPTSSGTLDGPEQLDGTVPVAGKASMLCRAFVASLDNQEFLFSNGEAEGARDNAFTDRISEGND